MGSCEVVANLDQQIDQLMANKKAEGKLTWTHNFFNNNGKRIEYEGFVDENAWRFGWATQIHFNGEEQTWGYHNKEGLIRGR